MHIIESPNPKKKWRAVFKDGKHTDFGSAGMNDFTIYSKQDAKIAESHKLRYRARHQKDLLTNDPRKAGYLSYYLLWNKPTLEMSLRDYKSRFGDL